MAIRTKSSGSNPTETFRHSIATGTLAQGVGIGIQTYFGESTITYDREVKSAEIVTGSATVLSISGKKVKYKVTSGESNQLVDFSVKVTFIDYIEISDIITTSNKPINYVKRKSTGTYFWTRPTTVALQLPWSYFKTWELKRTDGLNPASSIGTIASNSTTSTTGTGTYDISGIYYGDRLEFTYTLKPGGSVDVYNGERLTVDPDFSISNTTASTGELPSPAAELNSQWNFEKKDKDTVKNASNAEALTITVTKPAELSGIGVNISICKTAAESYYMNKTLGIWGGINTDTSCNLSIQDGDTLTSSYTSLGSISASETSNTWTLCVDGGDKSWPRYVKVGIQMKIQDSYASAHKFSNSSGTLNAYKGTKTVASGDGDGGDTGSWGGGYGGWMPS